MKVTRFLLAAVGSLLAIGCSKETGPFLASTPPIAYVRYVNAVPDSGAFDWRPVDAIENSPFALGLNFRGFTPYQAMGAGARHLRIFPTSTDINVTSQIVIDSTITFAANTHYTVIHFGYTRPGSSPEDKLIILEDEFPANLGSQIALRVINLGLGLGAIDVFAPASTADPLPATPAFAAVPIGTASSYLQLPIGGINLRTTAAGTTDPVLASVVADTGATAVPTANLTTIGGSRQPGSVITALLFPASVLLSTAPQTTAFKNPSVVYLVDKNP
jgi:hypothetical protein